MLKNHLSAKELNQVVDLDKEAHKEISWWKRTGKKDFQLQNKAMFLYMIYDKDKVIGFIRLSEDKRRTKQKTICIEDIFIKKEFRKRGYGKKALKNIISALKKDKVKVIKVIAPKQFQKKLYEAVGFKAQYVCLDMKL
ncbi:MAG: GNAT family N-acetyltransferase [Candidatus ainarchaeum sp.]|nr:GNAT family N-acetyltransferase [Candidatus ainarchaeum sp.]